MAFNINAHVILSGPKNIKAVTKNIQKQLGTVKASVQLDIPKNLGKNIGGFNKGIKNLTANLNTLQGAASSANTQLTTLSTKLTALNKAGSAVAQSQSRVQDSLKDTGKHARQAGNEIQAFGKDAALALRRFAGFTLATTVVFGFVRAVTSATTAALDFQREITKVVQVTGASVGQINKLKSTINELSVSLGVDANQLAELARIFSQTGQTIDEVRDSIRAVARSSLAPSFGEMKNTAEGLIAAMAQFNIAASRQEEVLSGLNAVSKRFAVESEDLISVIRRAGGVFSVAAGDMRDPVDSLNELIGIFTAVRSTTRESADTIAVGLRTIFTRIQRGSTIEFLKQFNIELIDAKGNFIGLFPAFQELSKGLDSIIKSGDALTLSAITEELGGVRQVGKLIPAITQFNKAIAATKVAGEAGLKGLGKDVALGLQPLGKQIELIQQRFSALIRTISESKTFQNLAKVALSLGNAFLKVAETLTPLLPVITTFAAIKISKGMFDFGAGFIGGLKKGGGGIAGVGDNLGGAISGAKDTASTAAKQTLTNAITKQTSLLTVNNTAVGQNNTAIGNLTPAINTASTNITTATTNVVGAIGNLTNALNRSALGGGGLPKFAKGGPVKGPSHAQGGVPAILEGGEYVIPKGYAKGGTAVVTLADHFGGAFLEKDKRLTAPTGLSLSGKNANLARPVIENYLRGQGLEQGLIATKTSGQTGRSLKAVLLGLDQAAKDKKLTKKITNPNMISNVAGLLGTSSKSVKGMTLSSARQALVSRGLLQDAAKGNVGTIKFRTDTSGLPAAFASKELMEAGLSNEMQAITQEAFENLLIGISKSASFEAVGVSGTPLEPNTQSLKDAVSGLINKDPKSARTTIEGYILEGLIASIGGMKLSGSQSTFDFKGGQVASEGFDDIFGLGAGAQMSGLKAFDAKRTSTTDAIHSIITGKIPKELTINDVKDAVVKRFAAGGNVFAKQGTDTVPAMLTPGEFVINKSSAKKIGYNNLKKMNRYAKGGVVGGNVQYLADGGTVSSSDASIAAAAKSMQLVSGLQMATGAVAGFTAAIAGFNLDTPISSLMALGMAAMQAVMTFKLMAPGLSKTIMRSETFGKAMTGLKRNFGEYAEQMDKAKKAWRVDARARIKAAKHTTKSALQAELKAGTIAGPDGVRISKTTGLPDQRNPVGKKWVKDRLVGRGKMDAMTKSTVKGKLPNVLKMFGRGLTTNLREVLKSSFKGFPGLLTSLIVGPIVGAIGKGVANSVFGKKEKIEGTNIEGRKGGSGAVAGALESAGSAVGSGLAAAAVTTMIPGLAPIAAPVVGGLVAAFEVLKGAFVGSAKQLEFIAFKELGKELKEATKLMAKFNKLEHISLEALTRFNDGISKVDKKFDTLFDKSFARERTDQAFTFTGMFGKGGFASERMGFGDTGAAAAGAATAALAGAATGFVALSAAAALAGTQIGSFVGTLIPIPVVGTTAGAIIGAVTGALVGLGTALFSTDKRAEAAGKAFDKAAKQITPEFLEELDKAFHNTVKSMMTDLEGLDKSVIADFSNINLGSTDLDPASAQRATTNSMGEFTKALQGTENALGGATGAGGRFIKEFNRLAALKVKFNLIDAVRTEAEFLSDEGSDKLKQAFQMMRSEIDFGDTPEGIADGFERLKNKISAMPRISDDAALAMENVLDAQKEQILAEVDAAATASMVAEAMRRAASQFDALAAGLDNFSNQTKGISSQLTTFTNNMKSEFESLFSDSLKIGQVNTVNPFANIDTSSRSQIRAGMAQVRGLSNDSDMGPFQGMSSLVESTKDIPFAMSDTIRELGKTIGSGEKVDETTVLKELKAQLKKRGVDIDTLPAQALKGIESILSATSRQEGGEIGIDAIKKILGEDGEVSKRLLELGEKARGSFEAAFDAATEYRNALLNIASMQQEMVQKETAMRLSLMDKQKNAIDRMNKAIGHTPDAMQAATGHLAKRLNKLTEQRVGEGGTTSGVGAVGNVFDVAQLITQRERLQQSRSDLRDQLGVDPGEIFSTDPVDVQDPAQKEAAKKLGLVNAQLNGNTAALKELANDTRMLAAIEQQIMDLQKKALAAEQSSLTLAKAQIAVASGEMTPEDFKKNFTDPLNALHSYSRGGEISPQMLVRLQEKFAQGDPAFTGIFDNMVEDITAQRQGKGETVRDAVTGKQRLITEADVRQEINDQMNEQIVGAGAATGVGGPGMNQFSREQLLRSRTLRDKAQGKAAEGATLAEKQAEAQEALFENQKAGFQEIFKTANEGLKAAVDKFQEAVDDFRDLRGLGMNQVDAAKKELDAGKEVKRLQDKLDNTQDPVEREKIEKQLVDAQAKHDKAKRNRQNAETAAKDDLDQAKRDVEHKRAEAKQAKEQEAQLEANKRGRERASGMLAAVNSLGGGEHFLSRLAESRGISDEQLGVAGSDTWTDQTKHGRSQGLDDMLGVGQDAWGDWMGFGNNEEFNEDQFTGDKARAERKQAFTNLAEGMFGSGTEQAIKFADILKQTFASVQAMGGHAGDFGDAVQQALKTMLEEEKERAPVKQEELDAAKQRTLDTEAAFNTAENDLSTLEDIQAQEAADIASLLSAAQSRGSLFTHDVHLEKLVHAILATLQGKEAVSPELTKSAVMPELSKAAILPELGGAAGHFMHVDQAKKKIDSGKKTIEQDNEPVRGSTLIKEMLDDNLAVQGAMGAAGLVKQIASPALATLIPGGTPLGGAMMDSVGATAKLGLQTVLPGLAPMLQKGKDMATNVAQQTGMDKVLTGAKALIDQADVALGAKITHVRDQFDGKKSDGVMREVAIEDIAATGNINDSCCDAIVNGLAALGNIFKEGLVKVAPEVAKETAKATAKAETSDPAASTSVEMGENERAVRERHKREDAELAKMQAEMQAEMDEITEGIDLDGLDLSAYEDAGRKQAEQIKKDNKAKRDKEIAEAQAQDAGLLRSPAEQAGLDAASRAKHAADIDASFADIATRVKKADPKALENKRKAETAVNIGASEFSARPGDHITRFKAFREAARHSADPSLRGYAGSLDQDRLPTGARDKLIQQQQAEDQARIKAEADKAMKLQQLVEPVPETTESQGQSEVLHSSDIQPTPKMATNQDPATDVGMALAEAAQSIRTSLVEGGVEVGSSIATSMKDNMEPVGAAIAKSIKDNLSGNIIEISAKMGPIQVQLTDGGGALRKMDTGIVSKFEALLSGFVNKLFNTDMSINQNATQTSLQVAKNTANN